MVMLTVSEEELLRVFGPKREETTFSLITLRKMTLLGNSWSLFITKKIWIYEYKSKVVGMDGL